MGVTLICEVGQNPPSCGRKFWSPLWAKSRKKFPLVSKRMPSSIIRNSPSCLFRVHVVETENGGSYYHHRVQFHEIFTLRCCYYVQWFNEVKLAPFIPKTWRNDVVIFATSIIFVNTLQIGTYLGFAYLHPIKGVKKDNVHMYVAKITYKIQCCNFTSFSVKLWTYFIMLNLGLNTL